MEQLICHLFGDYVIQNQWMASNKTKSSLPALVHAVTYSLPFLLLQPSLMGWLVIFSTHFVIDRWRLAFYWCKWWGVGMYGKLWGQPSPNSPEIPAFLSVWLLIVVDNTAHLTINYLSIRFL